MKKLDLINLNYKEISGRKGDLKSNLIYKRFLGCLWNIKPIIMQGTAFSKQMNYVNVTLHAIICRVCGQASK